LFERMDQASETFKMLEVVRTINDGGIRAVCFAENGSEDATVVFRGTGGEYEAWRDNLYGEYMAETDMQKLASDFIVYDCGIYENITVSGHSKGGNLAQYVTAVCPDKIDRCVSYDGQGFGEKFFEKNGAAVSTAASKIISVSAHNDFVNILLTPIAGKRIFVENSGTGAYAHSSYWMLVSSRFDENGSFLSITRQDMAMQVLERAVSFAAKRLDRLPADGNVVFGNLLASLTASVMSNEKSKEYEQNELRQAADALHEYALSFINISGRFQEEPIKLITCYNYMAVVNMKHVCANLQEALEAVGRTAGKMEDMEGRMQDRLIFRLYTDIAVRRIISRLYDEQKKIIVLCEVLREVISLYEVKETQLAGQIALTVLQN
ncbi:MAG TPA: DUF2974 domain-containing protein, partial [Lachnospiraceae bacterium]|nr:DUF2974 domain-containing protein [Lachnospiraceae bacterium]